MLRETDEVIESPEAASSLVVPLASIRISERFRKDMGDIDALAESIRDRGLLQTPVVTSDMELLCGRRRMEACRRLGWDEIEVRVVDPDDTLLAERDENEVRKDFTSSERVEIARAIEERIGDRRGERTDLASANVEPVQNFAQVEPGVKTRDIAAKKAGFGNRETYRQAATVVDLAIPELAEMVDREEVPVSVAAKVAKEDHSVQKAAVLGGVEGVKQTAKAIDATKAAEKAQTPPRKPDLAGQNMLPVCEAEPEVEEEEEIEEEWIEPAPKGKAKKESPEDPAAQGGWWWVLKMLGKVEQSVLYYGEREWFARNANPAQRETVARTFDRFAGQLKRWSEILREQA